MTITTSQSVPNTHMSRYDELVKANNGRYVYDPLPLWSSFRVEVEFESVQDYNSFCRAWESSTTNICEVRASPQRRLWRKIVGRWRNRAM